MIPSVGSMAMSAASFSKSIDFQNVIHVDVSSWISETDVLRTYGRRCSWRVEMVPQRDARKAIEISKCVHGYAVPTLSMIESMVLLLLLFTAAS